MLEDADLIGSTISYIRENHLTAERAFEWRVLEWEAQWSHTAHPMVLDKLNDLADVQSRVLRHLMGLPGLTLPTGVPSVGILNGAPSWKLKLFQKISLPRMTLSSAGGNRSESSAFGTTPMPLL